MNNFLKKYSTVKINSHGGILPPGRLQQIIEVLDRLHVDHIRFGLRQCIYIDLHRTLLEEFTLAMKAMAIPIDLNESKPNVISAYPVEEIFPSTTWLSEGVYKDILDSMDYEPSLKINLIDHAQSLTPLFTGNINWVASPHHAHYWHLYLRYPKTNIVEKWPHMIYTNDLMRFSKTLEEYINKNYSQYIDTPQINSTDIMGYMNSYPWIAIANHEDLPSTPFNLTYYEGLNAYGDHHWLGIYERDEKFSISFLRDLCALCLETRIGQICTTPWKSMIIKGIESKDLIKWNHLLNQHHINVRHPLNELNFQVEDNSVAALDLKKYLIHQFNAEDIRTQGICFGIKTRAKSEVFCNILIKKRHLIQWGGFKSLAVYDILISDEFNPNARTGHIYAQGLFKYLLTDHLRSCINSYYKNRTNHFSKNQGIKTRSDPSKEIKKSKEYVYQCSHCHTWIDEGLSKEQQVYYSCTICDAPFSEFEKIDKTMCLVTTM